MAANGKLVLLAEDDRAQAEILQEVLEYEGFRVLLADDPMQVLWQLDEGPDAVLLDVGGVTDPRVADALRRLRPRPVLVLVSGDPRLSSIARVLGADGQFSKPYDLEALLACLRELLARRRRPAPPGLELSVGGG